MPYLEAAPSITAILEKYEDGNWVDVKSFFGGKLSILQNAAAKLDITFGNDKGSKADILRVGQYVRLWFGLGGLLGKPLFYGFAANPGWRSAPGGMSSSFECFDFLAQAGREQSQLINGFTNYDGWDPSMAIKDQIEALTNTPVTAGGCIGTNPRISIQTTDGLYFPDYTDRLTLIQKLNALCYVDGYPDMPVAYRVWQDGSGRVNHRQVQALNTSYPRATIQYASNLHDLDVRARSAKLATGAVVIGAQDPNAAITGLKFQANYSESSQAVSKGLWQMKSSQPILQSSDECLSWAKRLVTMYRQLYVSKVVTFHEGLYLVPGDVVTLDDTTTGRRENLRVTQADIEFAPGTYQQKLTLGNFTYLPTGLLTLNSP